MHGDAVERNQPGSAVMELRRTILEAVGAVEVEIKTSSEGHIAVFKFADGSSITRQMAPLQGGTPCFPELRQLLESVRDEHVRCGVLD